jgi:DNA invertase Pin-like site-specific DNA recombinase
LKEVSLETDFPISTIRDVFVLNKVPLRSNQKTTASDTQKPQRTFQGGIPYGYNILDGKLVIDPREIKIVRQILALHQKGMSFNAISILLSNQKIPSKLSKRWNDKTVASIIRKHPKGENNG